MRYVYVITYLISVSPIASLDSRQRQRVILLIKEDRVRNDEEGEDEDQEKDRVPSGLHVQRSAEHPTPCFVALHATRIVGCVYREQYYSQLRQRQRCELYSTVRIP